jgi:hypothetical protein
MEEGGVDAVVVGQQGGGFHPVNQGRLSVAPFSSSAIWSRSTAAAS